MEPVRTELLIMTTIADGTIARSPASGMTVSSASGNAVELADPSTAFQPALSPLTVSATSIPLHGTDPVFRDVAPVKQTAY